MSKYSALMVDLSGNNPLPQLKEYAAAGFTRIGLKATEGEAYNWSAHNALTDQAHKLNLDVAHYCFLHDENGADQAGYFLDRIKGHISPHDNIAADAEAVGVNGKITSAFEAKTVAAHPGVHQLIYGSPYFLRANEIRPTHGAGLWLADYTTAPRPEFIPPGWETWELWQFTQTGHAPGTSLQVDISRIANPARDLTRYQRSANKRCRKAMHDRKHKPTASARTDMDSTITALTHAKGITS